MYNTHTYIYIYIYVFIIYIYICIRCILCVYIFGLAQRGVQ